MRLILHAGTHKTGTTSIQQALHANRTWLRERGVHYPDPEGWFGGNPAAHHAFSHAVAGIGEASVDDARRFIEAVADATEEGETVLLSAEPVYRHVIGPPDDDWWARHSAYLDGLASVLRPFDVEVFLIFRRRDAFIESVYHEQVSNGYSKPFERMIRDVGDRMLDYDRQLSCFRSSFSAVTAQSYEALAQPDLLEGFVHLLGVDDPLPTAPSWDRRSADGRLTVWLAGRNAEDPSPEGVAAGRRFTRSRAAASLFGDHGKVTLWVDPPQRMQVLERYGDTDPITDGRRPAIVTSEERRMIDKAFSASSTPRRQSPAKQERAKVAETRAEPGARYHCPACRSDVKAFRPGGHKGRPNAKCPNCGALERHRFLALLLEQHGPFLASSSAVLDIAPQPQVAAVLRRLAGDAYLATDLFPDLDIHVRMDLTRMPVASDSLDLIVCYHVLEHVPADRAAMRELSRVLKPGGMLLMQVPWNRKGITEENPYADEEERLRRFGQRDHVRLYGTDMEDRLSESGLRPARVWPTSILSTEQLERFGIPPRGVMWICRPAAPQPLGGPPELSGLLPVPTSPVAAIGGEAAWDGRELDSLRTAVEALTSQLASPPTRRSVTPTGIPRRVARQAYRQLRASTWLRPHLDRLAARLR